MIAHLFKLIWNKKKQNFLLMLEMLVSFIVLFAVFTLLVFYYKNFAKSAGFDYRNVWTLNYGIPPGIKDPDSVDLAVDAFKRQILSLPQVKSVSIASSNVPFSMTQMNSTVNANHQNVMAHTYKGEVAYKDLLGLQMASGSWFSKADIQSGKPVVINETLKSKLFGRQSAEGKILTLGEDKLKVVGVVKDFKSSGDYQSVEPGIYQPIDTSDYRQGNALLIKVTPDANAAFEAELYKLVSDFSKGTSVEIEHLTKKRVSKNNITLVPMIILIVVASFLIINVALGLFGVLWYNINKRKSEIGLRRALGATGNSISMQLVGETLVLSTLSLIIGSFFAVQFPLLNVFDMPADVYIISIGLSIAFIYLLVTCCSLYPGKQAARIYPAVALHEE